MAESEAKGRNAVPKITFSPVPVPEAPTVVGSNPPKDIEAAAAALTSALGAGSVLKVEKAHKGDPFIVVKTEKLFDAICFLRDDSNFLCTNLEVIATVDYLAKDAVPAVDAQPAQPAVQPRIENVYVISSFQFKHQFTIKVYLDRDQPKVQSICDLYRSANWYERECYDMVGVVFVGHPNHARVLLPTDWVGHPLRRDYVFPEEYNGMKVPL